MNHAIGLTPIGREIAITLLMASPLILTAFWIGTMLRRSVGMREWFGLILLWAVALPLLRLCFTAPAYVPQPPSRTPAPANSGVMAPMPPGTPGTTRPRSPAVTTTPRILDDAPPTFDRRAEEVPEN